MKSATRHMIESFCSIAPEAGWNEALKALETVKVVPSKQVKFLKGGTKPKPRNCYLNAAMVCFRNPEMKYVEGYYEVHGVPLDHAWNATPDGLHFDVTAEVIRPKTSADALVRCPHRAIMTLTHDELMEFLSTELKMGPYYHKWMYEKSRSQEKMAKAPRGKLSAKDFLFDL